MNDCLLESLLFPDQLESAESYFVKASCLLEDTLDYLKVFDALEFAKF